MFCRTARFSKAEVDEEKDENTTNFRENDEFKYSAYAIHSTNNGSLCHYSTKSLDSTRIATKEPSFLLSVETIFDESGRIRREQ